MAFAIWLIIQSAALVMLVAVDLAPPDAPRCLAPEFDCETNPKIYLVELTGEFGRDIALPALKEVIDDAKLEKPDVLVLKVDADFTNRFGERVRDFWCEGLASDHLELTREIESNLIHSIARDPEWNPKPRVVVWVHKALGGAAFLPFIAKEIYYTRDARHGGIGYHALALADPMKDLFQSRSAHGNSLRAGRAEFLAVQSGHSLEILRAMIRIDYVLSATIRNGKAEFFEDSSGDMLLTDDGAMDRRDTNSELLEMTGNDVLVLDAEMACRLGMSSGTADTLDELSQVMGVGGDALITYGRSRELLRQWSRDARTGNDLVSAWRTECDKWFMEGEYSRLGLEAASPAQKVVREKRLALTRQALAIVRKYGESLNTRECPEFPEPMKTKMTIMRDALIQQREADRRRP